MEGTERKVVTGMLILVWVSMGLFMEVGGPTMIDLRIKFDANSEEVARSMAGTGVGVFVGALLAGLTVDLLRSWKILLIAGSALLTTVTLVCMPFVSNLGLLWLMFFFLGISAGVINVAGQRILLEMWREKAPSPMHAMHMGFGIGALMAPILCNPFLAVLDFTDKPTQTNNSGSTLTRTPSTQSDASNFVILQESRVHLAYITIGLLCSVISSPFFIYPVFKALRNPGSKKYENMDKEPPETVTSKSLFVRILDSINPATYADGSFKFGVFLFVLVFLFYANVVGSEQLFGNFVRTFSVDEIKFTRNEASYLDTVFWGAFTLGRFTGSIVAHFVDIRSLFVMDMVLNLIAVTFADIYATKNKASLWACTATVGFFVASLYPAGISFINTQIEVVGAVLTLILFATGFGQLLYVWMEGALYESYGPRTILYTVQTAAILICIIVIALTVASCKRGDRFTREVQKLSESTTVTANPREQMQYTKLDQSSTQSEDD